MLTEFFALVTDIKENVMSDLNELFAELKNEIADYFTPGDVIYENALNSVYTLDELINNGEFARAEQDAYIG